MKSEKLADVFYFFRLGLKNYAINNFANKVFEIFYKGNNFTNKVCEIFYEGNNFANKVFEIFYEGNNFVNKVFKIFYKGKIKSPIDNLNLKKGSFVVLFVLFYKTKSTTKLS